MLITILGLVAAVLTSLSYIPQVRKAMPRGATEDLSLRTLVTLAAGLGLWITYGVFQKDLAIICANVVGVGLVLALLCFKIRDLRKV